jgi:hypothetical protein
LVASRVNAGYKEGLLHNVGWHDVLLRRLQLCAVALLLCSFFAGCSGSKKEKLIRSSAPPRNTADTVRSADLRARFPSLEICALIVNRDCLSDQIHGPFGPTRAKKMQAVCMIGFDCEDSSTEAGGLFESTGSMQDRRLLQYLLNADHHGSSSVPQSVARVIS